MCKNKIFAVFIFLGVICMECCLAQNVVPDLPKAIKITDAENYGQGEQIIFDFYQQYISPVKGQAKCPMFPSCSQYARLAFSELSWSRAYIKSFDRLLRCGHESYLYPKRHIKNRSYLFDPVVKDTATGTMVVSETGSKRLWGAITESDSATVFADFLFEKGLYDRAITEYYRIIFAEKNRDKKITLYQSIGLCYYHSGGYSDYIDFMAQNNSEFDRDHSIGSDMYLILAKCYYYLDHYPEAITILENPDYFPKNSFTDPRFLHLGIFYARHFNWPAAINSLDQVSSGSAYKPSAERINRSLQNFPTLPQRNGTIAGILSAVIPGAGYIYCGRTRTGITSFIINGLFAWTIVDALDSKHYGIAATAGFLGLGWYAGNITGSVDAAGEYNDYTRHQFLNRLLEREGLTEYVK